MTTYTLTCKSMGMDCPFSVTSEDRNEAKIVTGAHAMDKHAEKMAAMPEEQKAGMDAQMDSMIQESSM